ncbi:MAG: hypothetical protein KI788_15845, partial [Mameliella sp.]|nr:hypothetical protein [Mameliella sp.]
IDVAAYTLADAREGFYRPEHQARVKRIVDDCIEITNAAFHVVLQLRPEPSIGYVEEKGKPIADLAYQAHHDLLVLGMLMDEGVTATVTKMRRGKALAMEERLKILDHVNNGVLTDRIEHERMLVAAAGSSLLIN